MIVTQTPLRVSLAGGGTDFAGYYEPEGGHVVSVAIDKYIYVVVKERYDDLIYVNYSKKEIAESVDAIEHELVREAMRLVGIERGVELTTLADIPSSGSGLGSSSSVTVGVLNALYQFTGRQVPAEQLAREACAIEIERCAKPIGVQDQYIAAHGGVLDLKMGPGPDVTARRLPINERDLFTLERSCMLFYSGITRKADSILATQRRNIGDRQAELGALRDLARGLSAELARGRIEAVGATLRESWEHKRRLADGIGTDAITAMVDGALEAGASGAKVCGAGGGGFVLVVCALERQGAVRDALRGYRELPLRVARSGSRVIFNSLAGANWL